MQYFSSAKLVSCLHIQCADGLSRLRWLSLAGEGISLILNGILLDGVMIVCTIVFLLEPQNLAASSVVLSRISPQGRSEEYFSLAWHVLHPVVHVLLTVWFCGGATGWASRSRVLLGMSPQIRSEEYVLSLAWSTLRQVLILLLVWFCGGTSELATTSVVLSRVSPMVGSEEYFPWLGFSCIN